jgi:DNA-binding winged helix-turn-helix (wHTH) protein
MASRLLPKESMTESGAPSPNEFSFGSFRLLRDQRLLLKDEEPVRLGGRAHEILAALLERPGVVVTKEELFARVWPKQFVEEGNLKFHVAALRKALGDGQDGNRFIANVPGRGYCFVGRIESSEPELPEPAARIPSAQPRQAPAPLARIVGRSDTIVTLATLRRDLEQTPQLASDVPRAANGIDRVESIVTLEKSIRRSDKWERAMKSAYAAKRASAGSNCCARRVWQSRSAAPRGRPKSACVGAIAD